jgi:putative effector of murein hydrolase
MIRSSLPKSITTPIGMSLSSSVGGEVPITIVMIILTGISGAILAPIVLTIFRIKNPVAKGIAIGTASHGIGTSKAIEMGEQEGAMSGLAIGLTGLMTVFILPILMKLFIKS